MRSIIYTGFIFLFFTVTVHAQYTENFAASFNGINSYVSVPNTAGLSPTTSITLEAWVNPTSLTVSTMAVIGKNYQTSYFLGIQTSGRVVFYPKGGTSFRSRVTGVVPVNQWTHIAATYDGTNTRIYINGILDTSSTAFTGAIGVNTDSLFIGADRVGTPTSLFFYGKLDNIRIWASSRTAAQIVLSKFSPLEILGPSGGYSNLRASFQLDNNALNYGGSELNIGHERNITYINYTNKAVNYLDYNNSLVVNGTTDDFNVNNNSTFNATTAITVEAWIKRDTTGTQPATQNILNKSGGTSRYDFGLYLYSSGQLIFDINSGSNLVSSSALITSSQWTHIAATYNTTDGYAILYINGIYVTSTIFSGHPAIPNDPDKLYIGGIGATSYAANRFKGQIDGVRIWKSVRSGTEIHDNMYKIVSNNNMANFDFDKYANATRSGGSTYLTGGVFTGSAHLSSAHTNVIKELSSPILSDDFGGYYTGYENNYRKFYIPDNNSNGIVDSLFISAAGIVTGMKAYVLLSHTYVTDMSLTLISPLGTTVTLISGRGSSGNDIMTIFTSQADSIASPGSDVNGPGIIAPFSPAIKPQQSMAAFNGQNEQGWWKLKCVDNSGGDYGYMHSWGINITPGLIPKTLKLTALIQGFYNSSLNKMKSDTVRVYLKNTSSPYADLDSSVKLLDSLGKGNFTFSNISNGVPFYIVLKHRNSVETWSSGGYAFTSDTLYYDFTLAASQAYQSNQIMVDSLPLEFAVYNGDADKNGFVNLTDLIQVFNDAAGFAGGYVNTDMTGDNTVNLTDLILTYNNSFNFVKKITP